MTKTINSREDARSIARARFNKLRSAFGSGSCASMPRLSAVYEALAHEHGFKSWHHMSAALPESASIAQTQPMKDSCVSTSWGRFLQTSSAEDIISKVDEILAQIGGPYNVVTNGRGRRLLQCVTRLRVWLRDECGVPNTSGEFHSCCTDFDSAVRLSFGFNNRGERSSAESRFEELSAAVLNCFSVYFSEESIRTYANKSLLISVPRTTRSQGRPSAEEELRNEDIQFAKQQVLFDSLTIHTALRDLQSGMTPDGHVLYALVNGVMVAQHISSFEAPLEGLSEVFILKANVEAKTPKANP